MDNIGLEIIEQSPLGVVLRVIFLLEKGIEIAPLRLPTMQASYRQEQARMSSIPSYLLLRYGKLKMHLNPCPVFGE
jgi:hypothetical protein